jgi:hypothetical protein
MGVTRNAPPRFTDCETVAVAMIDSPFLSPSDCSYSLAQGRKTQ